MRKSATEAPQSDGFLVTHIQLLGESCEKKSRRGGEAGESIERPGRGHDPTCGFFAENARIATPERPEKNSFASREIAFE